MSAAPENLGWLGAIVASSIALVAVQAIWYRLNPKQGIFRSLLAGVLAGLLVQVAAIALWRDWPFVVHFADLCIYVCAAYVFFHLINMGETARRVRLVIELAAAPRGLTRAELLARYGAREIVDRRLGRLAGSGQIRIAGERVMLGDVSVLGMALVVEMFKRLLGRAHEVRRPRVESSSNHV